MKMDFKNKQFVAIAAVILIGIVLAVLILGTGKSNEGAHENEAAHEHGAEPAARPQHGAEGHVHEIDHLPPPQEILKGTHGGKLFVQDGYGVEVVIFEQNVPPQFRIYTYQDNKPLDPALSDVTLQLERLGREPQQFVFTRENDYLASDTVVEEPHSFSVKITSKYNNKSYQFVYAQDEARVEMTDKQVAINSIEVLTAGPARIKSTLQMQGDVRLNADKSVHIVPRVGGIVESVSANAGDKVRKGQVLAAVSSQAIADLRSDLQAADKRVGLARSTYVREKQLWEEKISAERDYLQARHDLQNAEIDFGRIQQKLGALGASSKGQARYEIRSPIDGVVTNKQISQGQVVSELDSVFEVADLSSVWVEAIVYAKDVNSVKTGQKVTVKSTASDMQAVGTISYVGALVGAQSRTAMARVVLDNADRAWLPGLPVNVELTASEVEVPLAVSVEGLQELRGWTVVFGRYGRYFEARPLELGRRDDKYAEVLKGLQAGEKYAAGNSFLIKADIGKAGATHDH